MTKLEVPDIHCEMCVKRITNALTDAKLKFTVSLEDKTVEIDGDDSSVNTAVAALSDLGFEANRD